MRHLALLAAAALLALPQVAAAAEPPCLTPRELSSLSAFALPSVINGTAHTCSAVLPANAWLPRNGASLAERYSAARTNAWPEAKTAFIKISTAKNPETATIFQTLPDDSLRQIADAAFAGIVSGKVKPANCATIDRMAALLAPLPPENTAELISMLIGLATKGDKPQLGQLALCKA